MNKYSNFHPVLVTALLAVMLISSAFWLVGLAAPKAPPPAWGFFAHRKINRQAVFTLPPEMMVFYKKNIEYLAEHAVDPDMRRYATRHEAPRHYMDLDRYGKAPFPALPRRWTDALAQYAGYYLISEKNDTLPLFNSDEAGLLVTEDSLVQIRPSRQAISLDSLRSFFSAYVLPQYYEDQWWADCDTFAAYFKTSLPPCRGILVVDKFSEHGILPYFLNQMIFRLKQAFLDRDAAKILRLSADFGHYIADAHVPLHTTQNYNGQLTGQDGIHAFWETRLPELFADDTYDCWVGKASLIENQQAYFWDIVLTSHSHVDSVLQIEQSLREQFPPDRQFCNEMRGQVLVKTQCEDFSNAYHKRLGGMVEDRFRDAIIATGNAWYTAWVLAGQPDLAQLANAELVPEEETQPETKPGKALVRPHE